MKINKLKITLVLLSIFIVLFIVSGIIKLSLLLNNKQNKVLTLSNMNTITFVIYESLKNKHPKSEDGLIKCPFLGKEFKAIYNSKKELIDNWGTPYRIDISRNGATLNVNIHSAGTDKIFNTEDDLKLLKSYTK